MKVINFGSLNLDYTYKLKHIVKAGETITSSGLRISPGGKGLNQSIALARAGATVYHAGLIGIDGQKLKELCKSSGVDVSFLRTSDVRTGNAIIQVDEDGQNSIILFSGANREIKKDFVDEVIRNFSKGDVLVLQNEISCLDYIIDVSYNIGMIIILNPSPFDENLLACDLNKISMFILNEVEGEQITGCKESTDILSKLNELYPKAEVVLTLGASGSIYLGKGNQIKQDAIRVIAIDTTAAGDTFSGFFIAEYFDNGDAARALKLASIASAIAVTKIGASISIPLKEEVLKFNY